MKRSVLCVAILMQVLGGCLGASDPLPPDAGPVEETPLQQNATIIVLVDDARVDAWIAVGVAGSGAGGQDPTGPPAFSRVRFTVPHEATDLTAGATWTCTASAPSCRLHWTLYSPHDEQASGDATDSVEFHVVAPAPGDWRFVFQNALHSPAAVAYGIEGKVTVVAGSAR